MSGPASYNPRPIEGRPLSSEPQSSSSGAACRDAGPGRVRSARVPRNEPLWKKLSQRFALFTLLVAACAGLALPLNEMAKKYTVDFTNYYVGGKIVREGQPGRLYDAGLQQQIEREVSPHGGLFQPYLHPPFEALFFAALAGLSYPHAFLLWAALNLLLLGLIVYLLQCTGLHLSTGRHAVWLAICLLFMLLILGLGQDALPLALVFLLAFLALKRRWDYLAGLTLGLGLYRFQILLPFAFIFLLRRRWKLFAGFATMGVAELLVSAAMVGWTGLVQYVEVLAKVAGSATGPWADPRTAVLEMPSLRGGFGALLGDSFPHGSLFFLVLVTTLLLLGWAAWEFKSLERPEAPAFDLEFCLASIAALLASYHVFLTELTPLIVVAFLMLAYEGTRAREGKLKGRGATVLFLLFLGLFAAATAVHHPDFSVEVVPLLAMMAWLSWELAARRRHALI